jgi:hypothetical protein
MDGPIDDGASRAPIGSPLQVLRLLLVSFSTALALIGVAAAFFASGGDADDPVVEPSAAVAGIVALGVVSLLGVRLVEPALDCTTDDSLTASYRTRFFLRIASAEAVALVGFVAVVVTGAAWLYLVGIAFTALGFLRLAPSPRNLERDQDTLNERGCGRSLAAVLGARPGAA